MSSYNSQAKFIHIKLFLSKITSLPKLQFFEIFWHNFEKYPCPASAPLQKVMINFIRSIVL